YDILNGVLHYRIYPTSGTPGSFNTINLPFAQNLGTGCGGNDQRWENNDAGVNLLNGLCDGNYTVEVYSTADWNGAGSGTIYSSNLGANYKATFTVDNSGRSGIYESYIVMNANGSGNQFYDLGATTGNPDFNNTNLGTFCTTGSLLLAGAQNKIFK